MKFQFVHQHRDIYSIAGLCRVMNISQSGYFAWRKRPASKRQREDMVLLAHITYLWTGEGWLYLAVVIDLYSRRVIGWSASRHMKKDLVIDALNKASRKIGAIHRNIFLPWFFNLQSYPISQT